jgi:hypothetical protein
MSLNVSNTHQVDAVRGKCRREVGVRLVGDQARALVLDVVVERDPFALRVG